MSNRSCNCEWCSIRRDLDAAAPGDRGWQWARLWRYYLLLVFKCRESIAKGDHLCEVTIVETGELAGEDSVDFERELGAALTAGKQGGE